MKSRVEKRDFAFLTEETEKEFYYNKIDNPEENNNTEVDKLNTNSETPNKIEEITEETTEKRTPFFHCYSLTQKNYVEL